MGELNLVKILQKKENQPLTNTAIGSAADVVDFFTKECKESKKECIIALNIDAKGSPISMFYIGKEKIDSFVAMNDIATASEMFKQAILSNAASTILIHNDPLSQSKMDRRQFFTYINDLSCKMSIPILDLVTVEGNIATSIAAGEIYYCDDDKVKTPLELKTSDIRLEQKTDRVIVTDKQLENTSDAVNTLYEELAYLDRESAYILNLDDNGKPLNAQMITLGGLNTAGLEHRNVFKSTFLSNSKNAVIIHNHPSGDITPSKPDFDLYSRLKENAKILGININDSLVVGKNGIYSMENGTVEPYVSDSKTADEEIEF